MGTDGTYSEIPDQVRNETGETDTMVQIDESAYAQTGFTFDAAKSNNSGKIAGDGKLVLNLYYARDKHTITFKNYDGSETLHTYEAYYGTEIVYEGVEPTYSGREDYTYTFIGWTNHAESDSAFDSLGKVTGEKTFYAAFSLERKPEYKIGDVNGDSQVDTFDAIEILKHAAGLITLGKEELQAGNVNNTV